MATINISNLYPTGSDLFSDSESYMTDLGDSELDNVNGGISSIMLRIAAKSSLRCVNATVRITGIQTPRISMFC
ncbi:hypothetical protein VB735_31340 [Halotia wernerae UHCC 0503]|nr:hypothetical protein [Halotia wernerae UHCC 0503]